HAARASLIRSAASYRCDLLAGELSVSVFILLGKAPRRSPGCPSVQHRMMIRLAAGNGDAVRVAAQVFQNIVRGLLVSGCGRNDFTGFTFQLLKPELGVIGHRLTTSRELPFA